MTSTRRKFLFFLFILTFAVISPLTLFYAAGYRINWTWPPRPDQTFQKTGMLVMETKPAGADIYIDGKIQKNFFNSLLDTEEEKSVKTPAKIKYIAPGQYRVRLEKEGYWPWEKKLRVLPGQQTKIENITLFEKSLPLKISQGNIQEIYASPNKRYILLPQDGLIADTEEGGVVKIEKPDRTEEATSTPEEAAWSPDSQKFLMDSAVYSLDDIENFIDLQEELDGKVQNPKWKNNSTFYYQNQDTIRSFDVNSRSGKTILSAQGNIIDHLFSEEYLYTITNKGTRSSLEIYSTASPEDILRQIKLPYSTGYTFVHSSSGQINLHDKNYDILYRIAPLSPISPVRSIIENVKYTDSVNGKLIYANKFEIWRYNPSNGDTTLLTRISDPIIGINWHPTTNYILYYTKTDIRVIEAGERPKRNMTTLININDIRSPIIGEKGDFIYFTAEIGRDTGLYKLDL